MHFGASLRLLRVEAGWSLRDLSAAVGVSPAYLSRVEHGHDAPPTPDRLHAIAHALGVHTDLLHDLTGRSRVSGVEASFAARALHHEVLRRRLTPAQVARVLEFIDRTYPSTPASRPGEIAGLLGPGRIVRGARVTTLDDAVDLAAARLAPRGGAARVAEGLRRGGLLASAVGGGLLLPHVADGALAACLVVLTTPIPAGTPDDGPLRAVLAITGVPAGPPGLALLGRAARFGDVDLLAELAAAADDGEAIRLLEMFEGGRG